PEAHSERPPKTPSKTEAQNVFAPWAPSADPYQNAFHLQANARNPHRTNGQTPNVELIGRANQAPKNSTSDTIGRTVDRRSQDNERERPTSNRKIDLVDRCKN